LHKREFGGVGGVDDDDENHDHDEDRDYEHDGSGGDVLPPSMRVSASATPGVHAAPIIDDPCAAATTSTPRPSCFDDVFFSFCLRASGSRGVHCWRQCSTAKITRTSANRIGIRTYR
jgi:hypothetical protein